MTYSIVARDLDTGHLGIAVAIVILGLFFGNLYASVRIRSRLALLQSLLTIFAMAFIVLLPDKLRKRQCLVGRDSHPWSRVRRLKRESEACGL